MKETFYRYDTPMKICLLADIHDRPFGSIIDSIKRQKPDIIAIAGDILDSVHLSRPRAVMHRTDHALDFLKACAQQAPSFYSIGNHEWMLSDHDKQIIRDTGVTLVDNSWVSFRGSYIGGLTSAGSTAYAKYRKTKPDEYPHWKYHNQPQYSEPLTDWLDGFEKQKGFKLLLCHHPEYHAKYLKNRKIDLVLSGHAHGGQIRIFGQGLYAPGQGIFPKLTSGIHGNMIISRGLSNTGGMIPRLFNRREIVYIRK